MPVVRSIQVTPATATLAVAQQRTFQPIVVADPGANQAVTWSALPAGIVSITQAGAVTALAPGQATIVATSVATPGVSGLAAVVVALPDSMRVTVTANDTTRISVSSGAQILVPPGGMPAGTVIGLSAPTAQERAAGNRVAFTIDRATGGSAQGDAPFGFMAGASLLPPVCSISVPLAADETPQFARIRVTGGGTDATELVVPVDEIQATTVRQAIVRFRAFSLVELLPGRQARHTVRLLSSIDEGQTPTALYRAGSAGAGTTYTDSRQPLVLVHGIQLDKLSGSDFSNWLPDGAGEMWPTLLDAIRNDQELNAAFDPWVFRYPTYDRIVTNADRLNQLASTRFGGRDLVVIAHSMGGMVTAQAMLNHGLRADRLISLGTPYLGSPLANWRLAEVLDGLVAPELGAECRVDGPSVIIGSSALVSLIAAGSLGLQDLRTTSAVAQVLRTRVGQLNGRILAVAGVRSTFGPFATTCLIGPPSDGVVRVESAHPPGLTNVATIGSANHMTLYRDAQAVEFVIGQLRTYLRFLRPAALQVVSQPTAGAPAQPLRPALVISVLNRDGQPLPSAAVPVTVELQPANGGAALGGRTTIPSVSGVATFDDLTVDRTGTYTLRVSSPGLPPIVTAPISVTSGGGGGAGLGIGFGLEQFALIPAGQFQMGQAGIATPIRTVTLSAFRMQRTEVTQGQWRQVMAGTALANPSGFSNCGDTCPVERVSWLDIQVFLQRLNQQDPGKGYRLPTEAEWEYAARAGTTGDYGIAGPVCSFAWVGDNNCSQGKTWPVAQKPANAWGLHDMHGNVWEWVQDWYGPYPSTPQTNPTGPATGSVRVLRGGSWYNAIHARSASRSGDTPSTRGNGFGFRLARTP